MTTPVATVVFVMSSLTVGGSETKTVRLANSLAERGHVVTVAFLSEPRSLEEQLSSRVTLAYLDRRGKFSIAAARRLLDLLPSQGVVNLVAVNLYPTLYTWLATLLMRRRTRLLASINTTEFVTTKEARQMALYRHVLRGFDTLIFGAELQREIWCRRYRLGSRKQRTTVLHNGVDTLHFAPISGSERPVGLPSTRYLIGTVGKMRVEKAHADLVHAAAELRRRGFDVGVVIVGDGPERARLEGEISRCSMSGYVALAGEMLDVRPFLRSLDVFVITSVAVETFSNAALEAMATGCALVTSDVGGMSEMLRSGGGVTYPPGRVDVLTERLAELLADDARLDQMGKRAREVVLREFSWESMVTRFASLLLVQ